MRDLQAQTRVFIDGLAWCAECRHAVDRGWAHKEGCSLAPEVPPTKQELRSVWRSIIDARMARGRGSDA